MEEAHEAADSRCGGAVGRRAREAVRDQQSDEGVGQDAAVELTREPPLGEAHAGRVGGAQPAEQQSAKGRASEEREVVY